MMNSHQQFQQNTAMGSGLTRYRSAPSSYFASLLSSPGGDGGFGADDFAQLFNPRASSPETQIIFSRFMNATEETGPSDMTPPLLPPRKSEIEDYQPPPPPPPQQPQRNDYSFSNHNSEAAPAPDSASVDRAFASFNSNCAAAQPKMELPATATAASSLIRHSSSPAGLFANINIENDEKWWSHTSSRMMEPISEMGRENAADDAQFDQDYTVNSWDDYLKGAADKDRERFLIANDDQKNSAPNRPKTQLSHHLSLPKTSADLSAMEKLLQDSVPCKIRAKRGCATHPRSIAERVRRTKISERMRKLQELVPNMEKQTNTSDMLDLAVDYIKELQRQVKTLSDNQASCSCSTKQRS